MYSLILCALLAGPVDAAPPEQPASQPASEPVTPVETPPAEATPGGFADGFDESLTVGPFEISGRGFIQNDLRFVVGRPNAATNGELAGQYIRNETQLMGRLVVSVGEHIRAVAQLRPLFTGLAKTSTFEDLLDRTTIDPFWLELDDVFIELTNVAPGLDFKLGRQTVVWGTGDLFNPTNVLNARDFYDPLLFGRPIHNEMIVVRYQTPIDLSFTAIYIPVFRPARLPTTARAAFVGGAPVASARDQSALADLQDFQANTQNTLGFPIVNSVVPYPNAPAFLIQNGTAAAKVKGSFLNIDASLSYAYTHWDLPMPKSATVTTVQTREDPSQLLPSRVDTTTAIELVYPRYHMVGFDFSTSIEPLGGLGLWGEIGLFIPERAINFGINYGPESDQTLLRSLYGKDLPCNDQRSCAVLRTQPFVKATVGMDYLITKWLYVNAQYLYGFVDEFGADYLKHYLVATLDIKPFGDQYTLRLAGVVNLASNASAVAFPALILKPYPGLELYLGGLIFLGGATDKFGKPENGSTQVFFRARFSF